MCWSMGATVGMVTIGAAATAVTIRRREPAVIPATLAWFTLMEGLQIVGHATVDRCSLPANQVSAVLSYLHIAFQPFFINAFAMVLLRGRLHPAARVAVWIACGLAATVMILQLYPFAWAGTCTAETGLCGAPLCTVSGSWHIGWQLPLNDILAPVHVLPWSFGGHPAYLIAGFLVPLAYGAWRLVLWHAVAGPGLAFLLTQDLREMPAVWCLFSVGIVLIALSPWIRGRMSAPGWRPLAAPG